VLRIIGLLFIPQVAESYKSDSGSAQEQVQVQVQESVDAFTHAAEKAGIKVSAPAPSSAPVDAGPEHEEIDIAAAAREHAEKTLEKGATYADAAKDVVDAKVNGDV
jgi:imidazolonepropionase-like amidohydrolase